MTIHAPDIVINAGERPPAGFTLSRGRPSAIVETNGRATTVGVSGAEVTAQTIDGYGTTSGAAAVITTAAPLSMAASERKRLTYTGAADSGAVLVFT